MKSPTVIAPVARLVPFSSYVRLVRHSALREGSALVALLPAFDEAAQELGPILRYHQVGCTVSAAIDDAGARAGLGRATGHALARACPPLPSADELLRTFSEIERAETAAGIPTALLKGVYFAQRLYGGTQRRPQFDLDVLVRESHFRKAGNVLRSLGYKPRGHDLHSRTYSRGAMKIDLHGWLRRAPAYRIDEEILWRGVHPERMGSVNVPTLSDEWNLVLLSLSCFEDLGQGMAKLKQLMDLFLFLRQTDESVDWPAFMAHRSAERIDGIVAAVFTVVIALYGQAHELPHVQAMLARHRATAPVMSHLEAIALVAAPRKNPVNLAWFASIYPGSFTRYLAWFWYAGFPGNLRGLRPMRVFGAVSSFAGRRTRVP